MLLQRPGCRLAFVLMESDYGLNTDPCRIDGWLEQLMKQTGGGSSLTYRLWLSSHTKATAASIADYFGSEIAQHGAIKETLGHAAIKSSLSVRASLYGVDDSTMAQYQGAWEILQSSGNVVDYAALSAYLDEIGVFEALDLRQCDESDVEFLTKSLKKIQQKKFVQYMGSPNESLKN